MSTKLVYSDHTQWRNVEGQYHREDGPAIEWTNGSKFWYLHGELHHENGPAIEWSDGTKEWYQNGKLHRVDGPASEWSDGSTSWWFNGEQYSETEHALLTWERLTQEQQDDIIFGKSDVD